MNTSIAARLLELFEIPSVHYSIGTEGIGYNWAILHHQTDWSWEVCYIERGIKFESKVFMHEKDACEYFVIQVLSGSNTLDEKITKLENLKHNSNVNSN